MFTYKKYKDSAILTSYEGNDKKVQIPDTIDGLKVSKVASMCFFGIDKVEEIYFPDNVAIENNAIVDCPNLKTIYISTVSKLGNFVEDCDNVEIITSNSSTSRKMKNKNLENVNDVSIFEIWKTSDTTARIMKIKNIKKANGPKTIKIPNYINGLKITALAEYLFSEANLEEVILNNFVEELPARCFSRVRINSLTNLDQIKKVGENCFNDASINGELHFPNLEEVAYAGFYNSNFEFTVGRKIKNIESYGFAYSQIKEIHLPKHGEIIKQSTFASCCSLQKVTLPKTIKILESYAFEDCSDLREVKNLNNVMVFNSSIFADCDSFVVRISFNNGKLFKENAFSSTNLPQKIEVKDCTFEKGALSSCRCLKTVIFTDEFKEDFIINNLFYNAKNLYQVVLNNKIRIIKQNAFKYTTLKKINLEEVEVIEAYAFSETKLTEISLPKVKSLGSSAFEKNFHLKRASFFGNKTLEEFPTYLFFSCDLESIIFPENLKVIGLKALFNCCFKEVRLPSTIEKLKESFIGNNEKLEYLEIPASVKFFEENCLGDLGARTRKGTKLVLLGTPKIEKTNVFSSSIFKNATLDLSNCIMEEIPTATFKYLKAKELILPKNIKKIGSYAFSCARIENLVIDYDSIEEVGTHAFANSNIGNLQVPKNAKIFKSYCFFESHLQIDELKISAEEIEDSAFYSSGIIKEIIFEAEPKVLERDNFVRCGVSKISSSSSKVLSRLKSRTYFKTNYCEFEKIK